MARRLPHPLNITSTVCICVRMCTTEKVSLCFQLTARSLLVCVSVCVCVLSLLLSSLLPAQNGQIHSD